MTALLLTALLYMPLAPINPVEEDTLSSLAFHFSGGLSGPNGIVSAGPEIATRFETLVVHPFMVRATAAGSYAHTKSNLFPKGRLYTLTLGTDAIYYRGTNHLTGYIGFGFIYTMSRFDSFAHTADSLFRNEGVTDVDMEPEFGYRVVLGLRYHKNYSLELSVSELRPDFRKSGRDLSGTEMRTYQTTRTGTFKIMLGYVVPL
jgi:hypothetical protein